jgi:hypothetical protein
MSLQGQRLDGISAEADFLGDRDLGDPVSLRDAARRAYAMAEIHDLLKEIHNLLKEIDVAEVYDAFSHREPLWFSAHPVLVVARAIAYGYYVGNRCGRRTRETSKIRWERYQTVRA